MAHLTIDERAITAGRPRRPAARCSVITSSHPVWPSMVPLSRAIDGAAGGDCVAFAVALDTPVLTRLLTLAMLRWQRRRASRAICRAGGEVVGHFGVDPSLAQPSWMYELGTAAAEYTNRLMRPRGSHHLLRRIAERCVGCDPALGAVLVLGKKRSC